jgi:polysaccharide export outer membrane protein
LNTDSIINSEILKSKVDFNTKIQKNDLLWITVGGPNSEDLIALNSALGIPNPAAAGAAASQETPVLGYLVESDGTIKIPYVGKVKAIGYSRTELENILMQLFSEYTRNPVVNIRFLNYKVTVLGEVARPGIYSLPNERMTVLEALGFAGDLTIAGKRQDVTVVREENGERKFGKLNLLSKDIFTSDYFYLRNNDIIYIQPAPVKFFARERLPQFITLAASSLSLLLTVITISKL